MDNPAARRQASGADTALSNVVTSVTVSQQESEGQASEPAGSTGERHSPRAARSQVSTAVSFEGARAAGSAVQPERSVDEDSALSAAEPDGPVRSNRPQQGSRPANSLISTAVHPTLRNGHPAGGSHHQLAPPVQQQQLLLPLPASGQVPATQHGAHGRGVADHYASSPEVQRPHSITSHAAGTRAEGHGHGGRTGELGAGPAHSPRAHPARSSIRGATPASVYGQIQTAGPGPGSRSPRKHHQHSLHWAAGTGGGSAAAAAAPVMDPATAAAAAAAAFLGNGLVGGWGLVPGMGRGSASSPASGHGHPSLHHHPLLAAAAAGAGGPSGSGAAGPLPLPGPPFSLATLGQLQLHAAATMHQQASAASALAPGDGTAAPGASALPGPTGMQWRPTEQGARGHPGAGQPPPPPLQLQPPRLPAHPQHLEPAQASHPLPRHHPSQQLAPPLPRPSDGGLQAAEGSDAGGGDAAGALHNVGSAAGGMQDLGARGAGGGLEAGALGAMPSPITKPPADSSGNWAAHRPPATFAAPSAPQYALPAAMLGTAYPSGPGGPPQFALPPMHMHGLQGLLMSASISAAAAAAGTGAVASAAGAATPGHIQIKAEQQPPAAPPPQPPQPARQQQRQRRLAAQAGAAREPPAVPGQYVQQQQQPGLLQAQLSQHDQGLNPEGKGGPNAAVTPEALGPAVYLPSIPVGGDGTAGQSEVPDATGAGTAAASPETQGGVGGAVGTVHTAAPHPPPVPPAAHAAMQMYLPVMLPFGLVNAQLALTQAAAAAAAAGPAPQDQAPAAQLATTRASTSAVQPVAAAAQEVHMLQGLLHPQPSEHESTHLGAVDAFAGGAGGGGGGAGGGGGCAVAAGPGAGCQQNLLAAAVSAAHGVGGGGGGSGGSKAAAALTEGTVGASAGEAANVSRRNGPDGLDPAPRVDRAGLDSVAPAQHSAGSNRGVAIAGGAGAESPEAQGAASAPAVSVAETPTASVAAAVGGSQAVAPPNPAVLGVGDPDVLGAAAAGGFGGLAFAGNPEQLNHNNNNNNHAHSNAYGAGPSMTHTADYRSHLQVALSLLLQATSAAYNSQRQSGIAGAGEGSGIFGAAGPQASGSNALGHDASDGGAAGGSGAAGGAGAAGAGAVAHGAAAVGGDSSGGGGATDGSGRVAHMGGGAAPVGGHAAAAAGAAAAAAAQSMHGVAIGTVAAAPEPMETEGQVVEQAVGGGMRLGASPANAEARQASAGAAGGDPADGDAGAAGGGVAGAYQAAQWSSRWGGNGGGGGTAAAAGGGGAARSAMHGSSGAAGGHMGRGGHLGALSHGHAAAAPSHHHQSPQHGGHAYHHRASGDCGGSRSGDAARGGAAGGGGEGGGGGCSPGVAEVKGEMMQVDVGDEAGVGGAVAGASVGSAGGAAAVDAAGDGEQADNNSALALDGEAGHPAASVHATVIADGSDASEEGGGGDDSESIEVPPAATRGVDGGAGGGAAGGGGGVGNSKAAGEHLSQRFDGNRSRSREGQASKQQHELLLLGPPAAGAEAGVAGSHHAEARSPARHNAAPDPRDSSMGMAAGPSHDGTGSGSNGATTSDTVDMAEDDSRMGSASDHAGSEMDAADPGDALMLTDENLVPLDEHGGENGAENGAAGAAAMEDVGERGDDNDNAGSADDDDGGALAEADVGARTSVGPAAALLGTMGGGGGGASTGHMDPTAGSEDMGSPVDKAASHHPANHAANHGHHYPHHHAHPYAALHQPHTEGGGGGGAGPGGVRASNSANARHYHYHHHHQQQQQQQASQHQTVASLYVAAVAAATAAAAAASGGGGGGDGAAGDAGPGASGAAGHAAGVLLAGGSAEALRDRGSPAPQVAQLQAANSTAVSPAVQGHPSPRALAGGAAGSAGAGAVAAAPPTHHGHDERRFAAGAGPAFSASNAEHQPAGMPAGGSGAVGGSRSAGGAAAAAAPATATITGSAAALLARAAAGNESSSRGQGAAGSAQMHSSQGYGPGTQPPQREPPRERERAGGSPDVEQRACPYSQPDRRPQDPGEHRPWVQDRHAEQEQDANIEGQLEHAPPQAHVHSSTARHAQAGRHRRMDAAAAAAHANRDHNDNTTLAAMGLAALHPTSVLTTASQPVHYNAPRQEESQQQEARQQQGLQQQQLGDVEFRSAHGTAAGAVSAAADSAEAGGAAAAAAGAEARLEGPHATHGSAGGGGHHVFPGARASQDALPQVTEIHGSYAGMAATAAEAMAQLLHAERFAAAPDDAAAPPLPAALAEQAQASWRGGEDHMRSASPGGPSLSAVMPQFTEVHGAFMRRAGTAAEAQAGALRGSGDGGGLADGGLAAGLNETFASGAGPSGAAPGGGAVDGSRAVRTADALAGAAAGADDLRPANRPGAAAAARGGHDGNNGNTKAQSALHVAPLGSLGGGGDGRSGAGAGASGHGTRHGRSHGVAAGRANRAPAPAQAAVEAAHPGGCASGGGAAPRSPGGRCGSTGAPRASPGAVAAAVSASCEAAGLPGTVPLSHGFDEGMAAGPDLAAAAHRLAGSAGGEVGPVDSRAGARLQRMDAAGPTGSGAASGGAAAATVAEGWPRGHFMAPPGGTPPAVNGSGRAGGGPGGSGRQAHQAHAADAPLSTQANAYGGYDDEYDSDGERRRAEGPPRPQMTILVTSHAANSHHTVSGGTAVVSEADNGGTMGGTPGAGRRGGGSPAVAAWEEEFDGPHRPTQEAGQDAAENQQGSWRGARGARGLAGPTKSAVMSSGRVVEQAVSQHAPPNHLADHPSAVRPRRAGEDVKQEATADGAAAAGEGAEGAAGAAGAVGSNAAASTGGQSASGGGSRRDGCERARGMKRRRSQASLDSSRGEGEGAGALAMRAGEGGGQ